VIFPQLHGFVRGRCKDMPALIAGLSLPYSNGPAEGVNTKVEGSCSADRHHRFCASAELMTPCFSPVFNCPPRRALTAGSIVIGRA